MLPADLQEKLNSLTKAERPEPPERHDYGPSVEPREPAPASEAISSAGPDSPPEDGTREPEPAPADHTSLSDVRESLAAERASREALTREVEFLRRGQQAAQPHQPSLDEQFANLLNGITVDEETWTAAMADPRQGAQWATATLRAIADITNKATRAQAINELATEFARRDAAQQQTRNSDELNAEFFGSNPDLKQYEETVTGVAMRYAQELEPRRQRGEILDPDTVMREVARRSRATLKHYGIESRDANAAPAQQTTVARRRILPAKADMNIQSGGPKKAVPEWQQKLYQLARRAS